MNHVLVYSNDTVPGLIDPRYVAQRDLSSALTYLEKLGMAFVPMQSGSPARTRGQTDGYFGIICGGHRVSDGTDAGEGCLGGGVGSWHCWTLGT